MSKKPDDDDDNALSRREFFKQGAAAGVGAVGLTAIGATGAQAADANDTEWDYEVDVVILGGGGVGLTAAVRARDLGASVLVVEQNYDLGGKLAHSGGWTSLGGGDAIQERDRLGLDPDGLGLTAPLHPSEDFEDDPERLFTDMTDWSVVNDGAVAEYRYNDRELHRAWADNAPAVRQFLMDNHIRFSRIAGTHYGGGVSRARAPWAMIKLGDVTDIEAGTITTEDAGSTEEERSSPFNHQSMGPAPSATGFGAPGWIYGGFVIARSLEYSARKKGVRFMVNRHLDEVIREQQFSGRVLGVKASYTPRFDPETGERLESWWSDGNIDETKEVINIRARRGVIIGTGGYMGNIPFRTMFDPRMSEPSIQYGDGLMGVRHEDASGIVASMRVGANLAGMLQPYGYSLGTPHLVGTIGTRAVYDAVMPGHPVFKFIRAFGIPIGGGGWEHVIAVNQVGKRFYNESSIAANADTHAAYPPGSSGTNNPFTPLDWRNSSVEHVRDTYNKGAAADAALAMNEGSRGPDYASGPVWAIFDQNAVDANGWDLRHPYIAEPPDGFFHKADTLAELARKVTENPYQHMPLKYLEETVAKYNAAAEAGVDDEFEKPVMHKIETGPFYAAIIPLAVNDSYGGLRINGKAQVMDMNGQAIPGLYAGGEASGGGRQHGIGRATVTGYMAATNIVQEPLI
ncbi:FAD-binding protein [Devosia ginsengisoli]|uniref:FAD-binding protein n=1 Tax=Devosia ginsengisoli TaxID=400770 RepID=UPI0026ED1806|nr:FAD-binding protein [Devosia ginsengisoli]MCR6671243.1 FAD-binding protein [Devosia ginsengisoli]